MSDKSNVDLELAYEPFADLLIGRLHEAKTFLVPVGDYVDLFLDQDDIGSLAGFHVEDFKRAYRSLPRDDLLGVLGEDTVVALDRFHENLVSTPAQDRVTSEDDAEEFDAGPGSRPKSTHWRVRSATTPIRDRRAQAAGMYAAWLEAESGIADNSDAEPTQHRWTPLVWIRSLRVDPFRGVSHPAFAPARASEEASSGVGFDWPQLGIRLIAEIERGHLIIRGLVPRELEGRLATIRCRLAPEVVNSEFSPLPDTTYLSKSSEIEAYSTITSSGRLTIRIGVLAGPDPWPHGIVVPESMEVDIG